LQTDVIDLYQIHQWPDAVPVEETLGEVMRLRDEGKLRWIGVSNFSVAQTERACQAAPIHSTQPLYSLFDRQIEADLIPYCTREGISILPYSPLAQGLLTGKYRPDATFPPDDERAHYRRFQGEAFARYLAVADKLAGVARDKGLTLPQLAVAWLLRIPAVTCVLVGMSNPGQVTPALGATGVTFTEAEVDRIDAILADVPDVAIYS
jgi:aryl-alcohol dehydrogenase-like predicted oxidoreductase